MTRRRRRDLHGVLVVDKPGGRTSAQVVATVRHRLGVDRIGHTGTLDPLATGVLPLCIGEATKLASYLIADDKAYEAELELGVETDTLDADGAVVARAPEAAAAVDEAALRRVLAAMVGPQPQVPPMYSAVHSGGRRLHELARAGIEVDRAPRDIVVHRLDLIAFAPPRARVAIVCSKGTYVRVLVADAGRALGCGAHVTALRRTRSGRFTLADAVPLEAVATAPLVALPEALDLPRRVVTPDGVRLLADGRPVPLSDAGTVEGASDALVQLVSPEGALLAIARLEPEFARPVRIFTYGLTRPPDSANLPAPKVENPR